MYPSHNHATKETFLVSLASFSTSVQNEMLESLPKLLEIFFFTPYST